jgi:hypothetical protein
VLPALRNVGGQKPAASIPDILPGLIEQDT